MKKMGIKGENIATYQWNFSWTNIINLNKFEDISFLKRLWENFFYIE